jgi:hypothetical protein
MFNDTLSLFNSNKKFIDSIDLSKEVNKIEFKFGGYNEDIVEVYNWHLNFAYYTGKGYTPLKLEDHHYFSENSQMGGNYRQIKGGSIRAFQENLNQLIQLLKVHLMPALEEVKKAHFYKKWFDTIVKSDKLIREESKKSSPDKEKLDKLKRERSEALRILKDKWVTEVDGGRLWQISKSAAEGGLDFNLVPTLFFGTELENPLYTYHNEGKTLQEQLDNLILPVDTTTTTKHQVANFMFRFYTWLPTAIKDTYMTYRLRVNALKQFYTTLQMHVNFMKPLLIEITRKKESFDFNNLYKNFEIENPEFVNLFDYSYSFIRILGIRNFAKINRGSWEISDLEFTKYGLFLRTGKEIIGGKHKGKTGFLGKYDKKNKIFEFYKTNNKNISADEFKNLKKDEVHFDDLKKFPIMEYEFSQKRRVELKKSPQGLVQSPFMLNTINYIAYAWNIYEIACYREKIKESNLELIESFIEDIKTIKEDLLFYISDLEGEGDIVEKYSNDLINKNESEKESKPENSSSLIKDLFLGPFEFLFGVDFDNIFNKKNKSGSNSNSSSSDVKKEHLIIKLSAAEDMWKVYTIFKKSHGFVMY